ncbi:ABC transporter substrate-binding protein [Vibrio sp. MA40-2]|uniref:ABC transporter substrate-binding protein n=1 Tax=Vibrio sp. MA40-2 TaxID=3391828 RepID=UPI0039A57E46
MILRATLLLFLILNCVVALAADENRTLVVALGEEPNIGFDPILGWGQYGDPLFQSTILKRNSNLEIVTELANHYQILDDGLKWHIKLKQGVKFSDGKELTAADVSFTFDRIKTGRSTHDLSNLHHITVNNPYSITFVLKQPDITFIDKLLSIGIVPAHSYGTDYAQHPVGSGPYILKRWDKGQQIVLERNAHYFAQRPHFKTIIMLFSSEENRLALLNTKQLHLASIPQRYVGSVPDSYKKIAIVANDSRGIVWPMHAPGGKQPGNLVSSDWSIRKAVTLAIDKNLLVEKILNGYGSSATSLADGLPWGPTTQPSDTEIIQSVRLEEINHILATGGWIKKSSNAPREKDGIKAEFDLYFPAGDSLRRDLAITIAELVKPIGITIHPIGTSWDAIKTKMHSNPVLMGFGSHTISEPFYLYSSKNAGNGWYNSGYYNNQQVDLLLDKVKHSTSLEATYPYWTQIYNILNQDLPWTWLVNIDHLYAVDSCLDLGKTKPEPHQHGWPITSNITQWQWICE